MCTVSWTHQNGGYHLLCNRDEKRTRGTAFARAVFLRGGVCYIAPVDSDCGGTWLTANELGLSVCLLNGEAERRQAAPLLSRGLLLKELAWSESSAECRLRVRHLDLRTYAAFTLLVLEPGNPATVAQWDGADLTIDADADSRMPLTSSSFDAAGAREYRMREFARLVGSREHIDPAHLYWFHSDHGASPGAYSPCMHRDDAETVSFSWVVVTRDEIRFLYSPAPPCRSIASEQKILTRAA